MDIFYIISGREKTSPKRSKSSLKETGSRPLVGSHHVSLAAEVLYGSGGRTLEASVVQVYRYMHCIFTV
jgi:hypothetical protein